MVENVTTGSAQGERAPETLGAQLQAAALLHPHKDAIVHGERRTSYQELWERSRALAGVLQSMGIGAGERIGCLLQKNTEAMVTFLGAACSGGVFFPLDHNLPPEKLQYALELTHPSALIVDAEHLPLLERVPHAMPPGRILVIGPDPTGRHRTFAEVDAALSRTPALPECTPHDPVYLNFTSGTTGLPKGAVTTHANIWWNTRAAVEGFGLGPDDVHMAMFPVFVHPHELFARPVYLGGTTVLVDNVQPKTIARAITEHRVSALMAVAAIYETLVRLRDVRAYDLSCLRVPESGGMHVPPALVEQFSATFGRRILPVWGSTEATGIALHTPPDREYRPGSMGTPLPHYDVRVLDEQSGAELGPGEVGELVVAGPGVCKAYWDNPAEAAMHLHGGAFYTGDLVMRDADGFFHFQSRQTGMMKVGGLKVYPIEIENLLRSHPDISEVAVVKAFDDLHGEVPKAVIRPRDGAVITRSDIRKYCEDKLHRYKVPRIVELVDELPKTPGGKVAWKDL
jgi:long-chain acyl-CoA synthetase